jgi:RND family efflux transporter MFP subunit
MRLSPVRLWGLALAVLTAGVAGPAWVLAFQEPEAAAPAGPKEQEVQIAREAIQITPAAQYRRHLSLSPIRTLEVPAPVDGYVRTIAQKLGATPGKESELIRLDDARAQLVLKAAKARLQAAQVEKKLAKDADQQAMADARIEEAESEVALAQMDSERLIIRAPFAGEIHAVHVVEGQFVRAGQPLLTLCDLSQLQVDVPVEGAEVKEGGDQKLRSGETEITGKISVLLPASEAFEPLRNLTDTLQRAVVVFDNPTGKLKAGQTVFCDLIPLEPVVNVPTTATKTRMGGGFKVQVLRKNIVRDIPIKIHTKVGTERVFVSGAFSEGDELVSKTSLDLADGTPVRELLAPEGDVPAAAPLGTPAKPTRPATGAGF